MPTHRYERIPLAESSESEHQFNRSFFTGLPTTAPPSYLAPENLPHRNDENATTIMPSDRRLQQVDVEEASDPGISLWGSSDSGSTRDFNAAREDVIVRLMDRVERLEARLDAQLPSKEEVDVEALKRKERKNMRPAIVVTAALLLFMFGFGIMFVITRSIKYKYARVGSAKID